MTNAKRLPKYHETFIPILEVLKDGKPMHYNDLRKKVRDAFYSDLPQELLDQKTKSGDILILNRIGWGKSYLKEGRLIEQPERAMVQITEKGKKILQKGSYTLEDLKKDPDYIATGEEKRQKTEEVNIASDGETPEDMIDSGIRAIENKTTDELLTKIKTIDPYYFERVVLELLEKMGYGDFLETSKSGDGGIDGIINQDKLGLEKIYVQAKRFSENEVREKDIRNFIGAMSGDTSKGIFVTTSSFHQGAMKKAQDARHAIVLIDGKELSELMYKYNIGVQRSNLYEVKQLDEDYFEAN